MSCSFLITLPGLINRMQTVKFWIFTFNNDPRFCMSSSKWDHKDFIRCLLNTFVSQIIVWLQVSCDFQNFTQFLNNNRLLFLLNACIRLSQFITVANDSQSSAHSSWQMWQTTKHQQKASQQCYYVGYESIISNWNDYVNTVTLC